MITRSEVDEADRRIDGWIRRTPTISVLDAGRPVRFKLEYLQHSGSFKARGAFNRILAAREAGELPGAGVVVASGGNAGLAVAYAAAQLGVRAEVFVPLTAPAVKVDRLRGLGAIVHQHGREYAEAHAASAVRAAQSGALVCHAYDQPEVVAGQGTLGAELSDVDSVLVATGGGGLVAGIAAALEGHARVIAVEPYGAPTLNRALAEGRPVDVVVEGVAADSLGARRAGTIAFDVLARTGVTSVLVSDDAIETARHRLWQEYRIAVEHGAAAAYAALRTGAYTPAPTERLVMVLCGANTDPASLSAWDEEAAGRAEASTQ
jgi:threonine dehydratase